MSWRRGLGLLRRFAAPGQGSGLLASEATPFRALAGTPCAIAACWQVPHNPTPPQGWYGSLQRRQLASTPIDIGDGGGSGSSGGDSAGGSEAAKGPAMASALKISTDSSQLAQQGKRAEAMQLLEEGLRQHSAQYGAEDLSTAMLHAQLAHWRFVEGQYAAAVEAARAMYASWVQRFGEGTGEADFNGLRLGVALMGAGQAEAAFPLLERAGAAAMHNYNHHLRQLQSAAASDGATGQAMAAASAPMLDRLAQALLEARFFRALASLTLLAPKLEEEWGSKGQGALFFLAQEMSDSLAALLERLPAGHATVQCALREHGRLVSNMREQGLQEVGQSLTAHSLTLHELLEAPPPQPGDAAGAEQSKADGKPGPEV